MSQLRFAHIILKPGTLPVFNTRHHGQRLVDCIYFPETSDWNTVSDTPTRWKSDGSVTLPWTRVPKPVRQLYSKLTVPPRFATLGVSGYGAPPPGEPIHVGELHVVRSSIVQDAPDAVRRFLARAIRKLRRNHGTLTVVSRPVSEGQVFLGLLYSVVENPYNGGLLPEGWMPLKV